MKFKGLSFWGIFKLSLILDFLIPLILAPLVLIYYFIAPQKFSFNWDSKIELLGVTIDFGTGDMLAGVTVLIIGFIGLLIQCAILYLIAQKTMFGRIKIG